MSRLQKLAIATLSVTVALFTVGGLVRATGSGLGCPGWPRCYGHWFPPFGQHGILLQHALVEYSHRFTTVLATVLIVWLVVEAWRVPSARRAPVAWGATFAVPLLLLQAGLGAAVVKSGLNPALVTIHYANAMLLLACLVFTTVAAFVDLRAFKATGVHRRFAAHALGMTVATFGVILLGTFVRGEDAGLAFPDWPLMSGRAIPTLASAPAWAMFLHRAAVLLVFIGIVGMAARAWNRERDRPPVRLLALTAAGLFVVQALIGAAIVWSHLSPGARAAHEAVGGLVWAALVATTVLAYRLAPTGMEAIRAQARHDAKTAAPIAGGAAVLSLPMHEATSPLSAASIRDKAGAYVALTKPRIIILLLITTVPAMILAQGGWPSIWLVLATLAGGTLAAGGANVINCYVDRDIDSVMRRTRRRPLPAHQVPPLGALTFGIALSVVAFAFLWVTTNLLAASLAVAAIAFYVFVYTLWMKRSTPQNIVIGGAAGAVPALVGWAAVTGRVGLPAVILFLIVFYWTPPHFWALSMRYEADYRAAGVPMMPVVRGTNETTRLIVLYSFVLVALTLLLFPVAQLGGLYLATAMGLGGWFIAKAIKLRRDPSIPEAMRLFHFSNTYLALLFAAVAVDTILRAAVGGAA
ncbi:MAG TPA: heme o synthase [Actinomycetota bacterium]|nr:heme o synthase [Actinomycetota bacterium]